jgi:putative hydroxymethylpyrimidine transport system ATP-binding protein
LNEVLVFNRVSFSYEEDKLILQDCSFTVKKGEFVSIIGPSGCGKSTIFRLLTGLEKQYRGAIQLMEKVGYMPQRDLLFPWRTVAENASLALECTGVKPKKAKENALRYLELFGLADYCNKYPKNLSGGMRQRVSFVRTFLTGAPVLLLDEPFSALDAITKIKMQEWLYTQCVNWKKTILFITHDVEEALFLSDRIMVMTERGTGIAHEFIVPLPRQRMREDLQRTEVLRLKYEILQMLYQRVAL